MNPYEALQDSTREEVRKGMQERRLQNKTKKHQEYLKLLEEDIEAKLVGSEFTRLKIKNEASEKILTANLMEKIHVLDEPHLDPKSKSRAKEAIECYIKKIEEELPKSPKKAHGSIVKIRLKEWENKRIINSNIHIKETDPSALEPNKEAYLMIQKKYQTLNENLESKVSNAKNALMRYSNTNY